MGLHVAAFVGFLAAWLLVDAVVTPFQRDTLGIQSWASLLYLPHGVRVLAAWFMGWRAVPTLFLATAAGHVLIDDTAGRDLIVLSSLASSLCAVVAVALVTAAFPALSRRRDGPGIWRALLLVALLASFLNTFGQIFALVSAGQRIVFERPADLMHMFNITIGDLAGMVTLLAALTLAFRWQRGSERA